MKNKTTNLIKFTIVILMYIFGAYLYNKVPTSMPIHWNVYGDPDNFASREFALFFFPTLTLAISLLFSFLPKLDPKKQKYELFTRPWQIFQIVFILFFAYIYMISSLASIHTNLDVGKFIMLGIGVLFIIIGNYMSKIKQNFFVGIRTPWTLSDEKTWHKTHRFGGWCFIAGGLLFALNSFLQIYLLPVLIIIVILVSILPITYSYFVYKKQRGNNKTQIIK